EQYDAVQYEGYGPGGAALIVEGLTDNRNRTAADVRYIFTKFGGSLGTPGSVAWMFERKGVVLVPGDDVDEDDVTVAAADAGAEDVRDDGGVWQVVCDPSDLMGVRRALEDAGMTVDSAELAMLPKNLVDVDVDQARSLLKLVDALEENDDVQDVFFN